MAALLEALQTIDTTDGPQQDSNWFRGGTLHPDDDATRRALHELAAHIDVDLAGRAWADALGAPWDGIDRWFRGDVAVGNLLLDGSEQLTAVIDFGTCGVGDPACDLAIASTLLTVDGRHAFRDRLGVNMSTRTRWRGWALWKTPATCSSTYQHPEDAAEFTQATSPRRHPWRVRRLDPHDTGP